VDTTLRALAAALRKPARPLGKLPNLREDLRALASDLAVKPVPSSVARERRVRPAVFLTEAERIVDSLDAPVQLIRQHGRASAA
jgi:hypothetical protein